MPGRIILIHGPSSAGKSTLAQAAQLVLPEGFFRLSIDTLRDGGMLPLQGHGDWPGLRPAFFDGFHRSVAAFAAVGCDLLVEHIFDAHAPYDQARALWAGSDLFAVGLDCPLAVLRAREAARGDRAAGSAADDFARVHVGRRYDMRLDGTDPVQDNARRLAEGWARRGESSAFF